MLKKFAPFAGWAVVIGLLAVGVWRLPTTVPDVKPLPEPTVERPLILPATMDAKLGRLSRLSAKSLGVVTWIVPPSVAAQFDTDDQEQTLAFVATCEGDYDLGAVCLWTPKDKPAELYGPVWVRVRAGLGPQPPPGPEPKPLPKPIDPVPVDPFTLSLQSAWAMESLADHAYLPAIISVCTEAATATDDAKLATVKAYLAFVGGRVQSQVGKRLPAIRRVLDDEIERSVTAGQAITDTAPFTPELRSKAKTAFTRSATALSTLGAK
jgi:hypothetical protein